MTRLAEQALAENNCARDPRWNRALAVGRERSVRQPQEEMGTAAGSNEEITQHEGAYRQSVLRKHRSVIPMSGEMDEFSQRLSGPFGARLAENFQKQACYYNAMDFQEYVAEDTATVAECEDSLLTLFVAADVHRRVVYRMKGFRYVFNLSDPPLYVSEQTDQLPRRNLSLHPEFHVSWRFKPLPGNGAGKEQL